MGRDTITVSPSRPHEVVILTWLQIIASICYFLNGFVLGLSGYVAVLLVGDGFVVIFLLALVELGLGIVSLTLAYCLWIGRKGQTWVVSVIGAVLGVVISILTLILSAVWTGDLLEGMASSAQIILYVAIYVYLNMSSVRAFLAQSLNAADRPLGVPDELRIRITPQSANHGEMTFATSPARSLPKVIGVSIGNGVARPLQIDRRVLVSAGNYGGILTKSVLVYELGLSLEDCENLLDRFVQHGEARRIRTGPTTLYDFPSARSHLSKLQNHLVEIFLTNPKELERARLLALVDKANVTVTALDEALLDLERNGIILRTSDDSYRFRIRKGSRDSR